MRTPADAPSDDPGRLSTDEIELLRVLAEGLTSQAAARRLHVSPRTLRRRTSGLCERLEVDNPVQGVVWAVRNGVI